MKLIIVIIVNVIDNLNAYMLYMMKVLCTYIKNCGNDPWHPE